MEGQTGAFLIVKKGEPYRKGETLPLREGAMLLGRAWGGERPNVSSDSLHVSRTHAQIDCLQGVFTVTDLPTSKHGTRVGRQIAKGVSHTLKHGERIELAEGDVLLVFYSIVEAGDDPGRTLDYPHKGPEAALVLNKETRQVVVGGRTAAPQRDAVGPYLPPLGEQEARRDRRGDKGDGVGEGAPAR